MTENKFVKGLIIIFAPLLFITILGVIFFGGPTGFFALKATEYYIYSIVVSCFTILSRYGKSNWGLIPAFIATAIFTAILKQNYQYQAVPLPMLVLPLGLIFIGLNYLTAYFFKTEESKTAKALLFGVTATIMRTLVFFITQVSFKNLEMFNLAYHLQQGAQMFLMIGVGIAIGNHILTLKKEEEVDIVQKVRDYMNEDE